MKIFLLLLENSRRNLFLAVAASFIRGISSAGLIAVINSMIASLPNIPNWLPWLFIFLTLVVLLFTFIGGILQVRLSELIVYNLRLQMAEHILECPLRQLEIVGTSKLLATLTGDINSISGASIKISQMFVNLAIIFGVFIYLCWLSPWLFLLIYTSLGGVFAFYRFIQGKAIENFKLNRQIRDVLFSHFRSLTEGTKELKLHRPRRIAFMDRKLKAAATKSKDYSLEASSIFAFGSSLGIFLFYIGIGLLLVVFPKLTAVSTATVSSYVLATLYVFRPITAIGSSIPQLAQANVALDKIESLGLSLKAQVTEPNFPTGNDFDADWTSLELAGINHAYGKETDEHRFGLQNINLEFKPGEIVFVVGGNGSGKSTLIKIITGLYIPEHGKIFLNNLPVVDENREWYRQQFSVVFYDFYLFEQFIGIDASYQPKIQNYLKLLEIDNKVTVKDGILSTTNLSQGQRKRLALLTAYLEDRPIYIFDEWASDQDPAFKKVFYEKLLPDLKSRGKTVIAVTHDDQYFSYCDRLIKLDYGSLLTNISQVSQQIK